MMKLKRHSFIVVLILLVIVAMNFTNAGFFDNFKKDAKLSPVSTTVDIVNTPPYVVLFAQIPAGLGLPTAPYIPVAGQTTGQFSVLAIVHDDDGASDIPSTLTPGVDLFGGISSPPNSPIGSSMVLSYTAGWTVSCVTFPGCPDPQNEAWLIAIGTMPFYAPPTTNINNPNEAWSMGLQIKDNSGNIGSFAQSGQPGFTGPSNYVNIGTITGFGVAGSISFQSISLTAPNQIAAQPVVLTNLGNTPSSLGTTVTGATLTGTVNPSATMSASTFSVSTSSGGTPPAQCDVTGGTAQFLATGPITVQNGQLSYGGAGTDTLNLNFCIAANGVPLNSPGILSGPVASQYTGQFDATVT